MVGSKHDSTILRSKDLILQGQKVSQVSSFQGREILQRSLHKHFNGDPVSSLSECSKFDKPKENVTVTVQYSFEFVFWFKTLMANKNQPIYYM